MTKYTYDIPHETTYGACEQHIPDFNEAWSPIFEGMEDAIVEAPAVAGQVFIESFVVALEIILSMFSSCAG